MTLRRSVAVIFALAAAVLDASAERLALTPYSVAEGLPSDDVRALLVDHGGFLWAGTTDGLARFDGREFRVFGTADGLPHAATWCLLETREHELWAGTDRGLAFARLDDPAGRGFTAVRWADPAARPPGFRVAVTALAQDRAGGVWAGTTGGLVAFTRAGDGWSGHSIDLLALTGQPASSEPPSVTSIVESPDRALWVASADGLYHREAGGTWRWLTLADGLPTMVLRQLVVDAKGRAWAVGHGESLALLEADGDGRARVTSILPVRGGRDVDAHFTLGLGAGNEIWLGSWSGLTRFDGASAAPHALEHVGVSAGLPALQEPHAVIAGARGDLWIATNRAGLWHWHRDGAVTFDAQDGLGAGAGALRVARSGQVVALDHRDQHVLHGWTGSGFSTVRPRFPAAYPAAWLTPVLQDHTGAWWIGAATGVCRFPATAAVEGLDGAAPERCYGAADDLGAYVIGLFEDRQGDVWITLWSGTRQVRRWERRTNRLVAYGADDGLGPDFNITTIVDDAAGGIWFGAWSGGLYRFDGTRFRRFTEHDGIPEGSVVGAARAPDGRLWFARLRDGVLAVDDAAGPAPRARRLGRADGLVSDNAQTVSAGADGTVWIGSNRGLTRLDRDGRVTRHFGIRDGLPRAAVTTVFADPRGAVWALTIPSVVRLEAPPARPEPPVDPLIAALRAGGRPHAIPLGGLAVLDGLELPAAAPDLDVTLTSPTPARGAPVRYAVELDGPSTVHDAPRDDPHVELPRLASGRYELRVRTLALDGSASARPAVVRFVVEAPWWRRPWAWALALAVAGLAAFAAHRARVARLVAIEQTRTRIATDLHDDIGSSLSSIAVQSGLLHRRLTGLDEDDRRRLARITETAGELVETMGDIVWSVNPRYDHLSHLAHRMHHYAREATDAAGLVLTFEAPEEHDVTLDPPVRRQVYLVFKELVANAIKHSGATRLDVTLLRVGPLLELTVRDDGRGFAPDAERRAGTGLPSLQRRAESIGARLTFASEPGRGVAVVLSLTCATAVAPRTWRL